MSNAAALFEQVLQRESDNGRAWLGLGLVRLYQQDHQRAITALEKASQLMPRSAGTIVALGWAKVANKDMLGAEQVFRQAITADRNFAESHGGLAVSLT